MISTTWPAYKCTYAKSTYASSITIVSTAAFATIVQQKHLKVYKICPKYLPKPVKGGQAPFFAVTITLFSKYSDYANIFSEQKARALPKHGQQDLGIEIIPGATAPFSPFYNFLAPELETLWGYLSNNLAKGYICCSTSPAKAFILFAKKKNGSLRFCVNHRGPNCVTTKKCYPLPLIGKTLDLLSSARIYSKIDF